MAKSSKLVQPRKSKDKNHVGTITIEQQLVMTRAARRQKAIDAGVMVKSGSGYHGGNVKKQNRKERRHGKLVTKHGGGDND